MILAGLTGGMGCGKSFVATVLAACGAHIIEADELGRDVMRPGGAAYEGVLREFGEDVAAEDGTIDRSALALKVFSKPESLLRLNALVHPAVREMALRQAAVFAENDPAAVVVYVAAILIESGAYKDCGKIVVVSCTPEQQVERALMRPGALETDVRARMKRQLSLQEKQKFADYVIDASGTKIETVRRTKMVYEELRKLA